MWRQRRVQEAGRDKTSDSIGKKGLHSYARCIRMESWKVCRAMNLIQKAHLCEEIRIPLNESYMGGRC